MILEGRYGILVANLYGHSGASSDQSQFKINEALLAAAVLRAAEFPRTPYFLLGDINIDPQHSQVLVQAMENHLLHDLAIDWAPLDTSPPPTFCKEGVHAHMSGPGTTRIDVALANAPGAACVTNIAYDYEETAGYDHLPILITLSTTAFNYHILTPTRTRPTNVNDIRAQKWTAHQKQQLYKSVWRSYDTAFQNHLQRKDVNETHKIWCLALEDYLTQLQTPAARTYPYLSYPPKGQTMPLHNTPVMATFSTKHMTEENKLISKARKFVGQCQRLRNELVHWAKRLFNGAAPTLHEEQQHQERIQQYTEQVNASQTDSQQQQHTYTLNEIQTIMQTSEQDVTNQLKHQQQQLKQKCRERLTNKNKGFANTCKYIKDGYIPATSVLYDPVTGRPTTDPQRLHQLFLDFFEPVYHTHKQTPPSWPDFISCFGESIQHKPGAPVGPPSAQLLHLQAGRATTTMAPGLDDIRPIELALLPIDAWETRYELLKVAYATKTLPETYYDLASPAIRKRNPLPSGDAHAAFNQNATKPDNHRLLGVFSALYRVEGGAIFRQHLAWLISWLHPQLHGCVPGHDLSDVAWDAQAHIEHALLHDEDLVVYLLDYVKFFDMFDPEWTRSFLVHLGIDQQLADLIHQLYTNLRRRIKIGKHYGPIFRPTNGMAAGDSLALLVALCFVSSQFTCVQQHHPTLAMGACVDDRNIRGSYEEVTAAYQRILQFDHLAGHFNNLKKLAIVATQPATRRRLKQLNYGTAANPIHPQVTHTAPLVGETLNVTHRTLRTGPNSRTLHAFSAATRCSYANSNARFKTLALEAVAIPRMLTGCARCFPSSASLTRLRTKILLSVWSKARTMRCTEVVVAILNDPTRIDPWGALIMRTFTATRRALLRDSRRIDHCIQIWNTLGPDAHKSKIQGPAHVFKRIMLILGLQLNFNTSSSTIMIQDPSGLKLNLLQDEISYIKKVVVHWVRNAFMQNLAQRTLSHLTSQQRDEYFKENAEPAGYRKDYHGVTSMVDVHATTANIHKHRTDPHAQNIIKSFIAGSVRAGDRLHAAGIWQTDLCDHPECRKQNHHHTTEHMLWVCHHHHHTRQKHLNNIQQIIKQATKDHGIFAANHLDGILNNSAFRHTSVCPDDPLAYAHACRRQQENIALLTPTPKCIVHDKTPNLTYDTTAHNTYVRVFTDGSCLLPQSLLHASAGWAVYYGPKHPFNHKAGLKSRHQSSFRAEARAVLHVILHAATPTAIYCDCKGIVNWLTRIQHGQQLPKNHPDSDIWTRIVPLINFWEADHFQFHWIPSHLNDPKNTKKKDRYLKQGGTFQNIADNDAVDKLAGAAASQHAPNPSRAALAGYRAKLTAATQDMMLNIWKDERARLNLQQAEFQTDLTTQQCMDEDLASQSHELNELGQIEEMRLGGNDFHTDSIDDFEPDPWFGHVDMDGNDVPGHVSPPLVPPTHSPAQPFTNLPPTPKGQLAPPQLETRKLTQPGPLQSYASTTPAASSAIDPPLSEPTLHDTQHDISTEKVHTLAKATLNTVRQDYPQYPYHDDQLVQLDKIYIQPNKLPNTVPCYTTTSQHNNPLRLLTHWWEPYAWFFHNIQWTASTSEMCDAQHAHTLQQYQTTYYELAIACDMLTGGTIAHGCDLHTKTRFMRAAFDHFHRAATLTYKHHTISLKDLFQPTPHAASHILLGGLRTHGIRRRACFPQFPDLPSNVAAILVANIQIAAQPHQFGMGTAVPRLLRSQWEPDTLVHYNLQCDDLLKIQKDALKRNAAPPLRQHVHSHRRPRLGPCHFGHPTTSGVDATGKPRWNAAPSVPPLWPDMPPGATLCQRCFEHYRSASIRGKVPTIPATPRCLTLGATAPTTIFDHKHAHTSTKPTNPPPTCSETALPSSSDKCTPMTEQYTVPPANDAARRRQIKSQSASSPRTAPLPTHASRTGLHIRRSEIAFAQNLPPKPPITHVHTRPPDRQ